MAVLMTLGVVFVALVAWASITLVIPFCLREGLELDLMRIRDSLVNDMLSERIEDRDAAGSLVAAIELLARNTRKLTPARAWFFGRMPDTMAASVPDMLPTPSGPGSDRVADYRQQVQRRVQRFLRHGSLSAWLSFPVRLLSGNTEPDLAVLCRGLALLEHFDALELHVPYV